MSTLKTPWLSLPQSVCQQARARWGSGQNAAGPGDGYLYHWVRETPPVGYCGPLPVGQLVRRRKEV